MKMLESKTRGISVGFIDPYIVNEYTLHRHREDVEHDLYTFLNNHNLKREILFPYNFKWVFLSCTHSFSAYSMLSVDDELCMSAYVNVRRHHWIMLSIQVDKSLVEVYYPLKRDLPFDDMKAMLHK